MHSNIANDTKAHFIAKHASYMDRNMTYGQIMQTVKASIYEEYILAFLNFVQAIMAIK